MTPDGDELVAEVLVQYAICRRAVWLWRGASVAAAVVLGTIGWWWAAAIAFALFQFLAYATRWHTVRDVEVGLGLDEQVQREIVRTGKLRPPSSVRDKMLAIRPLGAQGSRDE